MTIDRATFLIALLAGLLAAFPAAEAKKKAKDADAEDDKDKKEASWDVEKPPGETYEVAIDVESGTWMNLDVSPDGGEIVFDLLGDLYAIPLAGGEARALTSGLAWDMQPRYSPDGEWIAFTSDRGGGDNVWIVKRDGSDPRQVTKEDFRLVNDPVWSPDGDFIAVHKHFSSRRSLGAGEIWLYHETGGTGLQLNEKPNDQKDLGEPAFSPDGRYVYFSHDSTPGGVFQYNKDPNDQIYTVHRIDRASGKVETFIDGPGGAVCPTPSPDGRWIAFVRRVRFKSALYLHDVVTGENRMLTDVLERDQQETWAIHGVYPNMAWSPDSRWVVFWAGGGIHRIDVETRELVDIPFHVRQTHRMAEALRFPVEVLPAELDLRMLRWVQVSPRGDKVVFEALGRLWLRGLDGDGQPLGEARRLTGQDDFFELYPSWSRDGQQIAYVTWNDDELGAVRVVEAEGGGTASREGRVITKDPGHYVEPVFAPDGTFVVYRKTGGGFVTSPLWSRDPGLYKVRAKGGPSVRISDHGQRPHFGLGSDRVYFMTVEGAGDRRELHSVGFGEDLDSRAELVHVGSEAASDFRVSPDGRWLAFTERFNAYVTPFPASGRTVELGPKTDKLPIRQVSRDAGEYLHFSGDAARLFWALGPELFSRDLKDAFAFLEGSPEELPEPPEKGVRLGFSVPTDRPGGKVALVGARIVTMNGDEVIEDGTIVVDGARIAAVGPRAEVEVPADAFRLDVAGRTVIPGIVDAHWHGSQGSAEIVPQRNWFNYAALAFGVTTVHDPSNDTSTFFAAGEMARAGLITAPRLFSTGTILYGAAGSFKAIVNSLDDARSHLRRMRAVGAFSVKSYNQPRRDQRQQVIAAARELGMMVVPEGGSTLQHNLTMIVDGHTGIEHNVPVPAIYDDVLQLWAASRSGYTPTLVVSYGGISGERYWYQHTDVWANERLLSFVPREVVDPASRRRTMAPEEEYHHVDAARVCKRLTDAGVKVNVGAHGQREGLGAHWEMWMLVQGGMTPHEALRAATWNGAHYLGLDGDLGSLEVGKLADLAVLDENPLEDVRKSESVRYVMVNGRLYDAATMNQIGNHPEERRKFFWEDAQAVELGWER